MGSYRCWSNLMPLSSKVEALKASCFIKNTYIIVRYFKELDKSSTWSVYRWSRLTTHILDSVYLDLSKSVTIFSASSFLCKDSATKIVLCCTMLLAKMYESHYNTKISMRFLLALIGNKWTVSHKQKYDMISTTMVALGFGHSYISNIWQIRFFSAF